MSRFIAAIAGLFLVPSGATGQSAGAVFPVRDLPVSRVESPPFAAVTDVVEVGDNAVLVHDMERRRVVLLDSALALVRVVLDSVAATTSVHRYGQAPGRLIPYHGDSALFVDQASSSFLLLDSDGRVARVMGIPRYQDIGALITGEPPRVDTRNRLVYRLGLRPAAGVARAPASEARGPGALRDTAAIVRGSGLPTGVDAFVPTRAPGDGGLKIFDTDDVGRHAVLAKLHSDAAASLPMVREQLARRELAGLVVNQVTTLATLERDRLSRRARIGTVLAAGAGLALLLAAVGLYAVVSLAVEQRRREIGILLALGATGARIVRSFIGSSVRLGATGLLLGLPLSIFTSRALIASLGLSVWGIAAALSLAVLAIATLSGWIPARRASAVDPVEALRAD